MGVSLADFEDADRKIIERLYQELHVVSAMLTPETGPLDGKALRAHFQAAPWRSLMNSMKSFGQATYVVRPDPDIKKVMHDLRGGPLAVLLLRLQTVGEKFGPLEAGRLSRLAREHMELMRSCVRGIDTEKRGISESNGAPSR